MATQKSYQTLHSLAHSRFSPRENNTTSHADDRPPTELYTEQSCAGPSTEGNEQTIKSNSLHELRRNGCQRCCAPAERLRKKRDKLSREIRRQSCIYGNPIDTSLAPGRYAADYYVPDVTNPHYATATLAQNAIYCERVLGSGRDRLSLWFLTGVHLQTRQDRHSRERRSFCGSQRTVCAGEDSHSSR
ncbi:hypothetical protein AVEN_191971-1 [Araneus ventricosus]|uniref:Uncharacterized protein n=1 Tax=Araneus ventricosus TaxID=182803 RepID=A0A4Y2QSS3_ARAVE|nr:hypothetical protein AVEN_191971-1 [Araneus ventricosus]